MSGLGTKLRVVAADIAPGDFTTMTGFRRAVDVTPVLKSWGRGKKRVVDQLTGVVVDRVDGTSTTLPVGVIDKNGDEAMYTVYRRYLA